MPFLMFLFSQSQQNSFVVSFLAISFSLDQEIWQVLCLINHHPWKLVMEVPRSHPNGNANLPPSKQDTHIRHITTAITICQLSAIPSSQASQRLHEHLVI